MMEYVYNYLVIYLLDARHVKYLESLPIQMLYGAILSWIFTEGYFLLQSCRDAVRELACCYKLHLQVEFIA